MNTDLEEQEDELLALQNIFDSEEFVRNESKSTGEIRVSVELPSDFNVVLKHGGTLRQYDISFLPPLLLTFELPEDYPSSSPPSFTLTCSWLTHPQLALLSAQLTDLYQTTGGAVVLFSWIQFLKEDALKLLDIHNLLELPLEKHSSLPDKRDKPDLCGPELSVSSGEIQFNSSATAEITDSQRTSESDSRETNQKDVTSLPGQSSLTTSSKTDHPKALQSEDTVKKQNPSDTTAFQISAFKTDNQEDKSEHLPSSESVQNRQENILNQSVSASAFPPSSSSNPQHLREKEAACSPVQPTDISPNKEQTFSGLSLTPSQKLLSQILIYEATQKQKVFATTVFNCGVCYSGWLGSECVKLHECGHVFCRACLSEFCKVQITEGNVQGVTCPQGGCTATPTPPQVKNLVGEELFSRYDRLLLQSTLDCMPDVTYCPRQSCGCPVILEESSSAAVCSVCSFAFCVNCKKTYHGTNKCHNIVKQKSAEILPHLQHLQHLQQLPESEEGMKALLDDYTSGSNKRRRLLENRYGRQILLTSEMNLSEDWKAVNTKPCPHCFCPIQKDGGCPRMYCTQCQRLFMWI